MTIPFRFYSPDSISDVIHYDVSGWTSTNSVLLLNGFESMFELYAEFNEFNWDGSLPDTISFWGAGTSGWPSGMGELNYIQYHFQINQVGTFCIDSTGCSILDWDWLWEHPSPNFNGPYCWIVSCPDDIDCDSVADTIDNCYYTYNPVSYTHLRAHET